MLPSGGPHLPVKKPNELCLDETGFYLWENKNTVTEQLISAFVFGSGIEQKSFFLNLKFQVSNIFCACTGCFELDLVRNPEKKFTVMLNK